MMRLKSNHKIETTLIENRSWIVNILLMLVDVLTISLAVLLSAGTRYLLEPIMGGAVNWSLIVSSLAFYLIFNIILAWLNGLYPGFGLAAVHEMQKVLYVVTLASVFLGVFLFLQQLALAYSRSIFVFTWILSALFMMLGRFAVRNRFSRFKWWGIPMVIIGSRENASPVIEKLIQSRRLGFRPVFYYDPKSNSYSPIHNVPVVESRQALQSLVKSAEIKHVVFTNPMDEITSKEFHWIRDVFQNILFILNTAPFGSLWVRTIDLHGTLAIETNYHLLNRRETIIKRILDMIITVLLLLVTFPIFIILALLVRLDSKGPILYTQKRLGINGEIFDSYKFRTMYEKAEEKLQELLANDPQANEQYKKYHKLINDPRVTRVGKVFRRYSLDELPQFINVLKGDMNLIGPRSYLPRELLAMGESAKIILKVKPGITGWWQVMGRNATSFKERLQLDKYYISNWSIWLDIYIIIKSAWVVISGQGL
ncbi:MAG: undecaprenyl-phosphate galactose phosphotransferase WbaP [Chloroflexota bacterium]|nr:undecaprenyl-phosphate galactose phosphotransferase WbaP [Chloroflexota bacterium]